MRTGLECAPLDPERRSLEVVERKGPGHPDSLCDAAAEAFSRRLSRAYLDATGEILHHNVDKALLVAGCTRAVFGGGEWLAPLELILAGRATTLPERDPHAIEEIGRAAAEEALGAVRHLDPRDPDQVRVRVAVRPGAVDLRDVFAAAARGAPLANDTSIGVGFAPLSRAERLALALDDRLGGLVRAETESPVGEDVKLMVVRTGETVRLTVAAAMVAPRVADESVYRKAVAAVHDVALAEARRVGFADVSCDVNAADRPGSLYLTLSGTSAECGDDGQVGRGNRACGLITPMRPMTLEAFAGKNPRTHVGKLLSLAAERSAAACARLEGVRGAECVLVSRIGAPVSEPQVAGVRLDAPEEVGRACRSRVEAILEEECAALPELWREIVGRGDGGAA